MRTLKRWLPPLLALLLAAAGAAMPYAVSTLQDSAVEKSRESRLLNAVSLTLQRGEDVQDVLLLLAGSTSELEWQGETNLTAADVAGAAEDAMRALQESGLIELVPQDMLDYDPALYIEPRLVMSMNEHSLSAVIWLCWLEEMPYNWIFIDDETGKMVRAFLNDTQFTEDTRVSLIPNASQTLGNRDPEEGVRRTEQWVKFLSGYYGMELLFDEEGVYDDGYSTYSALSFDRGPRQERGELRLEMHGAGVYFNV